MKRILSVCLIILFISNTIYAMGNERNELIDIANVFTKSNLQIDSWNVTIKENKDDAELSQVLHDLSSSYLVTKAENENSIIYSVKDTHKKGNIIVNYNVIFPKDETYQAELVVTIQGNTWDSDVQSTYIEIQSEITSKYFTENMKIFSCMTTRASAIIENDYVDNFTKKLKLQHKNTQNDNLKTVRNLEIIYGYTSLWGQKITIQDEPVNVQLVTQTLGNGDVQYTIGTPILINEY
ncbi:YwmB family TATA-box binding protein [Ornithinibacillus scapharcae]|uniref:YwmB family TATA-box binding protein n=1 Tax=Ornithinibacillus scapharcae TaxID=1147159 RepID=UPI000225AE8C|nr:YwmB family TATA-box binding protein [Ornithinibacillus scapharcae]